MTIDQKIKKAIEKRKGILLSQSHLYKVKIRLDRAKREVLMMDKVLKKEYEDIEKLEKMNINRLFKTVLGGKEQQLEIKRQEYLQAILNHKNLVKSLELMQFEIKILEEKISKLPELEKEIEILINQREQHIISNHGPNRLILIQYSQQIDEAISMKREIYEAKIIGTKVKRLLSKMIELLEEAVKKEDWNAFGKRGGIVEKVQKKFPLLKEKLFEFEDELLDVYKKREIHLKDDLVNIDKIVDIFYSNLISDWIIRQKVHNSLYNLDSLLDKIIRTLNSLDLEERKVANTIKYVTSRKKALLRDDLK